MRPKTRFINTRSIIIAILILSIYSICTSYYIWSVKDTTKNDTFSYLSEVAKQGAKTIKTRIEGDLQNQNSIAIYLGEQKSFDIEESMNILISESKENKFKRMGIIDLQGMATTTDGRSIDLSNRDYFIKALKGEASVSEPLVDKVGGKRINVYATPITKKDKVRGVLFATNELDSYNELLEVSFFNGRGYSYIVRKDGTNIVPSQHAESIKDYNNIFDVFMNDRIMDNDSLVKLKEDMEKGLGGVTTYSIDNKVKYMNYEPIGINDWYVHTVISRDAASQGAIYLVSATVSTSVVTILLLTVLIIYNLFSQWRNKKKLENLAYLDTITEYTNWNWFRIEAADILKKNKDKDFAVITFDIRRFRIINDVYGHVQGNKTLRYIADVVDSHKKENDRFARIESDNFVYLLEYTKEDDIITQISMLEEEIKIKCQEYSVTLVFGIYIVRDKNLEIGGMVDRAHLARRTVKADPNRLYGIYAADIRKRAHKEKEIEKEMELALRLQQFQIYLQPKFYFSNEKLAGAEALVRWIHPQKGIIPPNDFIPLFEKNGFIKQLDLYVFEQTCIQYHAWQQMKLMPHGMTISVNLSRIHINNMNLPDTLLQIANKWNVNPRYLEIELTESALIDNMEDPISFMSKIKENGFQISIDDFGSGYSSLNCLKDLTVDILKFDKAFLDESEGSNRGEHIMKNLVQMAKDLELTIVVEGVETKSQVEFLREIGCDIAQGYFYGKPMPSKNLEKILRDTDSERDIIS